MKDLLIQEASLGYTENGALTHTTSGSCCLDLFARGGAMRFADEQEILTLFSRAFTEDKSIAMKLLFYIRDVRGGLGERRFFRTVIRWLAQNETEVLLNNLAFIPEYGRYDDLLVLLDTPVKDACIAVMKMQLDADLEALKEEGKAVSLLAKWLPSVNASNAETVKQGKMLARAFKMSDACYRKTLSALRGRIDLMENRLREKDYTFNYEKQSAKALYKYRAAFWRNDSARYADFLKKASAGQARLNASTLSPYELVTPMLLGGKGMTEQEKTALNATWQSLPDYGCGQNVLAVIDTSGSMYYSCSSPMPAAVAMSLGLYCAERNEGLFKNCFITFSETPKVVELKGETFVDRLRYATSYSEIANTDLQAVFELILHTAVKHHLKQEHMPDRLVIISDMEFDSCMENADLTNYRLAKKNFEEAGYTLPQVVFWNVASRHANLPVKEDDAKTALVSGCTPRLFEMVAKGELSPYHFMLEVLSSQRYLPIAA